MASSRTDCVKALLKESHDLMDSDCARAAELAERAISLAAEADAPVLEAEGMIYLSRTLANTTGARQAVELAEKAVEKVSGTDSPKTHAMALNNLGNCLRRDHNPICAMDCYRSARQLYGELGDHRGVAVIDNAIGLTYRMMGAYEKAYRHFSRSLEAATAIGYELGRSLVLGNLAEMFLDQHDLDTAERYIRESLDLNLEKHRKIGIAFNLERLGHLGRERDDLEEAAEAYGNAVRVWRELGGSRHVVSTLCDLAAVLDGLGREDESRRCLEEAVREAEDTGRPELIGLAKSRLAEKRMDENGLDEVEDHLLEALELLEESGEAGMGRVLLLEMLSSCCQRTGRPEKALEYLRSAIDLEREFRRNQRELDVVRLRLREAFERSERQRAELEEALESIRTLRELLPICARCKKIRNDEGYWEQIDAYISQHSDTVFSHGLCPDCLRELYPNLPSSETETEGGEG